MTKIHQNKRHSDNKIVKIKKIIKVKWNIGNTYLLDWWRLKKKLVTFARNIKEMIGKKSKRGEGKLRTERRGKKWTEGAVAGIYSAILPTDSPTE
jgi:hypothetical protein